MKFLFISALAESHALALRLLSEGHDVKYYIHSKTEADVGDGLVPKVKNWLPWVKWADIVVVDDVAQKTDAGQFPGSEIAVKLRKAGKKVIGGTPLGDKLENDRLFAQQVFQQLGLDVVETARFTSFEAAKRFVQKYGGGWAVKHNEQVPRELNAVFWEPEEVIGFLDWLDEVYSDITKSKKVDFILQRAVKGIEIAVTAFFDGKQFVPNSIYVNREVKKMMNEDEGPPTGQVGEIGRFVGDCKLFRETVAKLAPILAEGGYCTWIDLNCIVTRDKVVPLEATARMGYPTVFAFTHGLQMPLGEFFASVVSGEGKPIQVSRDWIATVVVAGGTFPHEDPEKNKYLLIEGLEDNEGWRIHPNEVRFERGQYRGAGSMGYAAVVTAKGKTIESAAENAYEIARKIKVVPFRKIRTDIEKKPAEGYPKLLEWGWLQ